MLNEIVFLFNVYWNYVYYENIGNFMIKNSIINDILFYDKNFKYNFWIKYKCDC